MTPSVELLSATDPPHISKRHVWYYTEWDGMRSERLTDYRVVLQRADALCREHGACLVDRSDKGSGILLRLIA